MQAIVVTFDRLATSLLGCYGNEWIETPHLDRLASTSTVFDNHFADTIGPSAGVAWATGRHALRCHSDNEAIPLGRTLRAAGVKSQVIANEGAVSAWWQLAEFDAVQTVSGAEGLDIAPEAVPIAKLVRAGLAAWDDDSFAVEPRLLWLHAREPGLPPEGFSTLYVEDFEEHGVKLSELPREDWLRHPAVAAGSVSLVDHWLGELIARLNATPPTRPTLLVITAARGKCCLEETWSMPTHPPSNGRASPLRDQEVRAPLLVTVLSDPRSADLGGLRCERLVQPMDLVPTLFDWFCLPSGATTDSSRSLLREATSHDAPREYVCFSDEEGSFGIRSAEWSCLTRDGEGQAERIDAGAVQLFAKPEDIWDVNDIALQQPEICGRLLEELNLARR